MPAVLKRAGVLCGLLVLAYANTFSVPYLLDDAFNITNNSSIRSLRHLGAVLHSVDFTTAAGRPLLNLTFAANFALGGLEVGGYHAANLLIHGLATLGLFGLVRYSIGLADLGRKLPATSFAFVAAALWGLHPLQTESVTYLSERAESLMGLFYLLTLYGFARYAGEGRLRWAGFSVLACFCGMATKQAMVTAVPVVLLYDRAFCSASFRTALGRRPGYYAALGGSWLLLAALMRSFQVRAGSLGFHTPISPLAYALTEAKVILEYLKLSFFPRTLVLDYGSEYYPPHPWSFAGLAVVVLGLVAGAIALWRRSRPAGFLACSFFILLAPTSSIVPIAFQPMAESRMYLPLAAVLILALAAAWVHLGRWSRPALGAAIVAAALLTHHRNHQYRSALGIWEDTIAKNPHTSRGQNIYGLQLAHAGRRDEAIAHFQEAIRINPDEGDPYCNLADVLLTIDGRRDEAIALYRQALKMKPNLPPAHFGLANAFAASPGHVDDARQEYEATVRLAPTFAEAHNNLAATLMLLHRPEEAIKQFELALACEPGFTPARINLERVRRNPGSTRVGISPTP